MNKFIRGTIFTVGLLLCTIVLLLNIFIIEKIDDSLVEARERVILEIYNWKYLIIIIGIVAMILMSIKTIKIKNRDGEKNEIINSNSNL